jgi:DtxR family Mn-dependent transcriptional regulator
MISRATEDYLKTIHLLSESGGRVSTSSLAEKLDCSAASVTNMLQKLASLKLVEYQPYQGVRLTEPGGKVALEVIRHHRLIELYLKEVLGYSWDKVHEEAEKLEHVISDEFAERIDKALGHPTHDPHGHPIPPKNGSLRSDHLPTLWEIPKATDVIVTRVNDHDPSVLRYLDSLGIYPQVRITVLAKGPFNGPLEVQVETVSHSLSEELARQVFVTVA